MVDELRIVFSPWVDIVWIDQNVLLFCFVCPQLDLVSNHHQFCAFMQHPIPTIISMKIVFHTVFQEFCEFASPVTQLANFVYAKHNLFISR